MPAAFFECLTRFERAQQDIQKGRYFLKENEEGFSRKTVEKYRYQGVENSLHLQLGYRTIYMSGYYNGQERLTYKPFPCFCAIGLHPSAPCLP